MSFLAAKETKNLSLLIFLFLIPFKSLFATHYAFHNYAGDEAPDIGQVNMIMQDSRNFLWMAGQGGVAFFDGSQFHHLTVFDGLPRNYCYNITEAPTGDMFISTLGGLAIYNPSSGKVHGVPPEEYDAVRDVVFVEDDIFLGENRGLFILHNKQIFQLIPMDNGKNLYDNSFFLVHDVCYDSLNSNIWLAVDPFGAIKIDMNDLYDSMKNSVYLDTSYYVKSQDREAWGLISPWLNIDEAQENKSWGKVKLSKFTCDVTSFTNKNTELKSVLLNIYQHESGEIYGWGPEGFFAFKDNQAIQIKEINNFNIMKCSRIGVSRDKRIFTTGNDGLNIFKDNKLLNFSLKTGLSNNIIDSWFKDSQGTYWVSGKGKLNHLANLNIQLYLSSQYETLQNTQNSIVLCDGRILISSASGLSIFDGSSFQRMNVPEYVSRNVEEAEVDSKGNMLFASLKTIYHYDFKRKSYRTVYGPLDKPSFGKVRMARERGGKIWIIHGKLLQYWDGNKLITHPGFKQLLVWPEYLYVSNDTSVYVSAWAGFGKFKDGNLTIYSQRDDIKFDLDDTPPKNANLFLKQIFSENTTLNEYIKSKLHPEIIEYAESADLDSDLEHNILSKLITSLNNILDQHNLYNEKRFKNIDLSFSNLELLKTSPPYDYVRYVNRTLLGDAYPQSLGKEEITVQETWKKRPELIEKYGITSDSAGYALDHVTHFLPKNTIQTVLVQQCGEWDDKGREWFGTFATGIISFSNDSLKAFDRRSGLPSNHFFESHKAKDGSIYFLSTQSVCRIENNKPVTMDLDFPLPILLNSLTTDDKGRLYIATNRGLFVFNEEQTIILDDGFGLKEKSVEKIVKQNTGEMICIQTGGIFTFHPDSLFAYKNINVEPLVTAIWTDTNRVKINDRIVLPMGQRSIQINFALPDFLNPVGNLYSWKLEGLEDSFHDYSNSTKVTYDRLPPGEYAFYLKAINGVSRKSELKTPIEIVIPPYFYETTIFYILVTILGVVTVILIIKWSVRIVRIQNIRLERMVVKRTKELKAAQAEALEQLEKTKNAEIETQRMQTVTKLGASIAHEFNNPLSIIKGAVDICDLPGIEDNEKKKFIQRIPEQVSRMHALVDKLLKVQSLTEIDYADGVKILDIHSMDKKTDIPEEKKSTD